MEGKKSICRTLAALLTLLVFALNANPSSAGRPNPNGVASVEFIRTSCGKTDYPGLCIASLFSYASTIQTSPRQLAEAALSVSLTSTRNTSTIISRLSKQRGMSSREAQAMADCMENLGDSVEELKQSLQAMGELRGKDVGLHMSDIQTWVSAALTEENTCMYAFTGKEMQADNIQKSVRGHVVRVARLTSNALALVNGLAGTVPSSP